MPKISSNVVTFEQMDAGLLRGISVGGSLDMASITVDNEDDVSSIDDLLLTADWTLVEQSLTPIPADVRAGIDRDSRRCMFLRGQPLFDLLIGPEGIATPDSPALRDHIGNSDARATMQSVAILRARGGTMTHYGHTLQHDHHTPGCFTKRAVADEIAAHRGAASPLTETSRRSSTRLTAEINASRPTARSNMEYRAKLDLFAIPAAEARYFSFPIGTPANDPLLDFGKLIRLYADRDAGFPKLDRSTTSLEEIFR